MEKPDFSSYSPYMPPFDFDTSMSSDPVFNPMLQYEQGYSYYRYLCMQMDYKIKCKEYEKLCSNNQVSN